MVDEGVVVTVVVVFFFVFLEGGRLTLHVGSASCVKVIPSFAAIKQVRFANCERIAEARLSFVAGIDRSP